MHVFLVVEIHILFSQIVLHFSISNFLLIQSLFLLVSNLDFFSVNSSFLLLESKFLVGNSLLSGCFDVQLFFIELSLLFLDCKFLFTFEYLLFGSCFCLNLWKFCLSDKIFLSNGVVDFTLDFFSVLSWFFSEFGLKILEQTSWRNLDVNDFTGFEPDTPTSNDLLNFILYTISQLLSVFENIVDGHVCNSISDDRNSHIFKLLISNFWALRIFKISTKRFVASERSILLSVYAPDENSTNLNTLHFWCYLLCTKIHLVN